MSTTKIKNGKNFTVISLSDPIAELETYIYNGKDFFQNVDLLQADHFRNNMDQELLIYNKDGKILYSCSIAKIGINGKFEIFLTNAWKENGNNYKYDAFKHWKE